MSITKGSINNDFVLKVVDHLNHGFRDYLL